MKFTLAEFRIIEFKKPDLDPAPSGLQTLARASKKDGEDRVQNLFKQFVRTRNS
jgi:hypothetical protein